MSDLPWMVDTLLEEFMVRPLPVPVIESRSSGTTTARRHVVGSLQLDRLNDPELTWANADVPLGSIIVVVGAGAPPSDPRSYC